MATSKIVIFGGAFNPPTVAHEAIFEALLALPQFDEVWIMPSGDRLDKHIGVSDSHRLQMLQHAKKAQFEDELRLHISDFELTMPRPTQTYQTVQALEQSFPATEFWYAFGPDSYLSMPSWPNGPSLQRKVKVVLFSSGGPMVPAKGKLMRLHISDVFSDTSSTEARRSVAAGTSLLNMVSEPVARYILENQLYKPE